MKLEALAWKVFGWWAAIALLLFNIYCVFIARSFLPLYYNIIILLIGIPMWRYRHAIALRLQSWSAPVALKFIVLGFGMVLLEEFFAALTMNLNEGFSFSLWVVRILQFWAFNLIGFCPMIFGWLILTRKFGFSAKELLVIAGFWGIYAEKALLYEPLIAIVYTPISALVYAVIIAPAVLSLPAESCAPWPVLKRYGLGFIVMMLLAIFFVGILMFLRGRWPHFFPPCEFIAC